MTLFDNKKRNYEKRRIFNDWWPHAQMFPKCYKSFHTLLGFSLCFVSSIVCCRCTNLIDLHANSLWWFKTILWSFVFTFFIETDRQNFGKNFVLNVSVTQNDFSELNMWKWFQCVWDLPRNRWRFWCSISCCTQSHCRVLFAKTIALLSPCFLDFLFVHQSDKAQKSTFFFPNLHPFSNLWNKHSGRCHFSQNELVPIFLKQSPQNCRDILVLGLLFLGFLTLDAFLSFFCMVKMGEGFCCFEFVRFLVSWRKLQLSPFTHCPLNSHWQQSPKIFCARCFAFLILDHGVLLKIANTVSKVVVSNFLPDTFFSPWFFFCDDQFLTLSDVFPGQTIPMQNWVSQTLVFLICTIPPRCIMRDFCHRQWNSVSLRSNSWKSPIRRTIMKMWAQLTIESSVLVTRITRGSDMRSASIKETVFFVDFMFLQTDFSVKFGIEHEY